MKVEITLKNGLTFTLEEFGGEFICVNPPEGFSKESKEYIELKNRIKRWIQNKEKQ